MFNFALDICEVTYHDLASGVRVHEQLAHTGEATKLESSSIAKIGNFLYRSGGYNEQIASSGVVYRYNPRYRNWVELAAMSQPRVSHAMCSSEDRLFVFGGVYHFIGDLGDEDAILSSVEVYNVKDNSWSSDLVPELPRGLDGGPP